ncbi:AraC family transcriptional regulator [Paraflavitalea soli]|uniref:AraC family transcriptional regulator n=1 Tax=Paraflavitalea soli TaxID=2315862 RepID=A0A3B7MG98_9BACT|nr:helix-turn-helix domain-containing protein [Paraflavitalea soli]AXY73372.1 AraC family transcriptional regulator [Paraflavitalea soli]
MISFVSVLKTIITLGAVQGIIAGVLLFWGKRNRKANRILAVMLWLFSLACLDLRMNQESILYSSTLGGMIDAFIPFMIIMPLGPLLYFYIRASLEPDFRLQKQHRKHFYTALLDILPQLAAIIYITGIIMGIVKKSIPLGYYIDVYNNYVDIPRWLSLTIYLWLSARYLGASSAGGKVENATLLRWLRQFVRVFLAFQLIWFIYLIPYVIPRYSNKLLDLVEWYPVFIPLAILIYWLGIKALMVTYALPLAGKKSAPGTALAADTVEHTIATLKKAMERETLYLDPALNLTLLSQHTGIAPKTISAVLNQHFHTSLNEFVNEYRIRAFQKRLLEADLQKLTITGIAFDCGFNSQATFQRAFKQITGMSPSEYRKSVIQG